MHEEQVFDERDVTFDYGEGERMQSVVEGTIESCSVTAIILFTSQACMKCVPEDCYMFPCLSVCLFVHRKYSSTSEYILFFFLPLMRVPTTCLNYFFL